MGSVNGKVVLITGAANGVGAEVARRLHDRGAKLILTDLDEGRLKGVASRLDEHRVLGVVADVREFAAMQDAADAGIEKFGGIDIVMANAGIATVGTVRSIDPAAFTTLVDVNVVGVFNTVRAALPSVIERRGYVLVVSSLAGYLPAAGLAPYSLAKAGIEHFANALRLEVAHDGVGVGSAHMSWIDTPLVQEGKAECSAFKDTVERAPWPINKTTSLDKCGEAFIKGIEGRKRQINCPGWVGAFRWLRPLFTTSIGEKQMLSGLSARLAKMDAEVAASGRSMSARNDALEKR
jgi:NAD(P)-dependent dehydrogenase (short-subunit alcohol dehydrogenase family)